MSTEADVREPQSLPEGQETPGTPTEPWITPHPFDTVRFHRLSGDYLVITVPTTYRPDSYQTKDLPPARALETMSTVLDCLSGLSDAELTEGKSEYDPFPQAAEIATARLKKRLSEFRPDTFHNPATCRTSFTMGERLRNVRFKLEGSGGPYCFADLVPTNSDWAHKQDQDVDSRRKSVGTELRMDVDCDKHIRPNWNMIETPLEASTGERQFTVKPSVVLGSGQRRALTGERARFMTQHILTALADSSQQDFDQVKYQGKVTSNLQKAIDQRARQAFKGMKCSDFEGAGDWSFVTPIPLIIPRLRKDGNGVIDTGEQSRWTLSQWQNEYGFDSKLSRYIKDPQCSDDVRACLGLRNAMTIRATLGRDGRDPQNWDVTEQQLAAESDRVISDFANRQHFAGSYRGTLNDTLDTSQRWDSQALKFFDREVDVVEMAREVEDQCDQPSIAGITNIVSQLVSHSTLTHPDLDENALAESARKDLARMCEKSYLAQSIHKALAQQTSGARHYGRGLELKQDDLDSLVHHAQIAATQEAALTELLTRHEAPPPGVHPGAWSEVLASATGALLQDVDWGLQHMRTHHPDTPVSWNVKTALVDCANAGEQDYSLDSSWPGENVIEVDDEPDRATHLGVWLETDAWTNEPPLKPEWILQGQSSRHYESLRGARDYFEIPKLSSSNPPHRQDEIPQAASSQG